MSDRSAGWVVGGFFAVLVLSALVWNWYRAGVQRDVYHRQGIELSRWEVFVGAKPAQAVAGQQ